MRLGNYFRVFSALSVLLLWHSSASASDYKWFVNISSWSDRPFSSASAACDAYISSISGTFDSLVYIDDKNFSCRFRGGPNNSFGSYGIYRTGQACPENTINNPLLGECVALEPPEEDECADKAGIDEGFSKSGTAPDGFAFISSGGIGGTQRQGCKNGCALEIHDNRCKWGVAGAYYCRGTAMYTGQQCATTGTGDQIDEDTNESTEPETIKEDVPCVYSASGDKQVCESKKSEEKEGQSCGTVNGVPTCVSTPPKKNGVDISTEVTTEAHADGSTTITKKDTATSTTCTGINSCTSKTATTTTVIQKDADGNTTSTESKCTGAACGSSYNPDRDGDGLGDGEGEGSGGEGQDWYTPGDDTFESVLTQFAAAVKQTPIASKTTNFLTFRASGACPRWSVSVWVFDIDIDQLCSGNIPWDAIRAVILAAAAFLSFRIALF